MAVLDRPVHGLLSGLIDNEHGGDGSAAERYDCDVPGVFWSPQPGERVQKKDGDGEPSAGVEDAGQVSHKVGNEEEEDAADAVQCNHNAC